MVAASVQPARSSSAPLLLLAAGVALLAGFAAFTVAPATPADGALGIVWELAYDAVFWVGAAACFVRARRQAGERRAWTLIGLALVLNGGGYVYSSLHWMLGGSDLPWPSPADGFWFATYPLLYAGVLSLARARSGVRSGVGAEGALAALTICALGAEFLVPPLTSIAGSDPAAIITNVVYPLADIHLLAFVLWTRLLAGPRLGTAWHVLALTVGLTFATDLAYCVQIANDSYVWGGILDLGWPLMALGYAVAACLPDRPRADVRRREGLMLWVPAVAMLVGIVLLTKDAFEGDNVASVVLASLSLVAAAVRAGEVAITARRLQREVERRERQLGAAQALAHVGSYELDLRTGSVYWSDELWRMVGLAPGDGEMTADRSLSYIHPDDRRRIAEAIDLGRRYAGAFETTYRILRADGAIRHVAITGESDRRLVRAAVRDMTAEHEAEQRLRHAADHDHLTSLPNRRRFEREVEAALARGEELAVAVLDLDHFKFVNDSFGHVTGDALLCEVVHTLSSALEGGHVLARFGGDEFAVLLRSQDRDESLAAVERLLQALRDSCCTTTARSVTASAGLVVATDGADPQDLLKAADIALYEAKGAGRDRCALYRGPKGGLAWVEEVRAAIEAERLVLYSQPIVSLGSNEPREELLVRMLGTDGELLPPAAFIPTAEQFGLIADLDCWVVERALGLAAADRRIEVNISGATLGDERIPELVEQAAARGVDTSLLTFELTETAAVRDLEGASAFAQRIVELGCQVALDDFGTGYGSLIYLRHLPISQIKIDQEFVRSMIDDPGSRRIVAAIAGMAQTMGHETVAEGVEDLGALELLRALGVDYAQGFAIARPAPVAQLVRS